MNFVQEELIRKPYSLKIKNSVCKMGGDQMSEEYPIMLDLEPGTYYWCSCGKTQNQPFCDGSHEGTSYLPMEFTITEKKTVCAVQLQAHPECTLLRWVA